jgi:DNA-binding IclR family transcriptional regulator
VGKALVLDKTNSEILEILRKVPFEIYTENTLATPEAVLQDIMESRYLGYTKDNGEHEKDVYCVAYPIYDYRGQIVASASVTGFTNKIYEEEGANVRNALAATCFDISKRLGYVRREV